MRLKIPDDNCLFIVSAPSGCGKTSLIKKALAQLKNLKLSVSHTTRSPRPTEIDGQDYFFSGRDTFRKMIMQGDFLEYATVFDEYYGTSKFFVEKYLAEGYDIVMEIDWQGARQIKAHHIAAFSIFILPPSMQILRQRLEKRAQDSEKIIDFRMQQAVSEAQHFAEYNYVIVNDDFDRASAELIGILSRNTNVSEIETSKKLRAETIRMLGLHDHGIDDEQRR